MEYSAVAPACQRKPHRLHGPDMVWKQKNCYVDLWIELLHGWGLDPHAALPFTVAQDFEGDQFTFFKIPFEDLETLYGIVVQEHAIYESVLSHAVTQVARGRVMLIEVDAWYLPDTQGISYGRQHVKTTIGIDRIDLLNRRVGYFHNTGYYELEGEDFAGIFDHRAHSMTNATLPPYVECVKRVMPALPEVLLREVSLGLFIRHLRRVPDLSPIAAFRRALAGDAQRLVDQPPEFFHGYSFNTVRQMGANFELLGHYLRWIDMQRPSHVEPLGPLVDACQKLASESMVLEFRLARSAARSRVDRGESCLDILEASYDIVINGLHRNFGMPAAKLASEAAA
ncbi:MAG: DUF1839 family protein [Janthinobacterium lividum]